MRYLNKYLKIPLTKKNNILVVLFDNFLLIIFNTKNKLKKIFYIFYLLQLKNYKINEFSLFYFQVFKFYVRRKYIILHILYIY